MCEEGACMQVPHMYAGVLQGSVHIQRLDRALWHVQQQSLYVIAGCTESREQLLPQATCHYIERGQQLHLTADSRSRNCRYNLQQQ